MSFLSDRCSHGGSYGPTCCGCQLLDLCVQPPDDPLHGFPALSHNTVSVSPSEVTCKVALGKQTCRIFLDNIFLLLSTCLAKQYSSTEKVPSFLVYGKTIYDVYITCTKFVIYRIV